MDEQLKQILQRSTWTDPSIDLLIQEIIEYDMSDGGFSMIQEHQLVDSSMIDRLRSLPKGIERNKAVGKLRYNKKYQNLGKTLEEGFRYYRLRFGVDNDLSPEDILSVKRDAIFTKRFCYNLEFGDFIRFKEKNVYHAYLYLELDEPGRPKKKLEFYWGEEHVLDVKGLKDSVLNLHRDYILKTIWTFLRFLVLFDDKGAVRYIVSQMVDYKMLRLDPGYYREFTEDSIYKLHQDSRILSVSDIGSSQLAHCDVHYNYMQIYVQLFNLVSKEVKI